jgi:asparagine synthase (glutamine-hydrolysing)
VYAQIDVTEPRRIFERVFTFNSKLRYDTPEEQIQNSLYFEIKTFLAGLLLVGDKLSMANGLEERFPFLDNDLVDFAEEIPVRHKLGDLEHISILVVLVIFDRRRRRGADRAVDRSGGWKAPGPARGVFISGFQIIIGLPGTIGFHPH